MTTKGQEPKFGEVRPADDSEIRLAGQGELSIVYAVLRQYLERPQRHACWRKWGPILEKDPLFTGTPFKNVLAFTNQLAAEYGLDRMVKTKLRQELFRRLAEYHSATRFHTGLVPDQLYPVRFLAPGMNGFADGNMRRTTTNIFELITDRSILLGNPVRVLAKRQDEDGVVKIKGHITQIVSQADVRLDQVPQAYRFKVDRVAMVH